MPKANKELIKKFIFDIKLDGIIDSRLKKYVFTLKKVLKLVGESFDNPSKEDMKKAIEKLNDQGYTEWTIVSDISLIKRFYKWHLGKDEIYPECVSWLKRVKKPEQKTRPESLITKQEVNKLIEKAVNYKDKALILLMYDSGARIGELLNMKIKDVKFDNYGVVVSDFGKTGYRQVRIIGDSITYLRSWIDVHTHNNDPDFWLFNGLEGMNQDKAMTHIDVYAICSRKLQKDIILN